MSTFPSLPLFTDAYLADAGHLSDAEHGRYLLLLMAMWRAPDCRLPNDDEWLARRFRRTADEVRAELRPLIAEFMQTDGNWITQKRLKKEWKWCQERKIKNSAAAKSKWKKEKDICERNANTEGAGNAPNPNPNLERKEEDKTALRAASSGADGKYAFAGCILRLTKTDFGKWTEAYANLDLRAELVARDAWLASDRATDEDRRNWYISTSKYLANRNMEAKAKVAALRPDQRELADVNDPQWRQRHRLDGII